MVTETSSTLSFGVICAANDEPLLSSIWDYETDAPLIAQYAAASKVLSRCEVVVIHFPADALSFQQALQVAIGVGATGRRVATLALLAPELSLVQCQQVIMTGVRRAIRFSGEPSDAVTANCEIRQLVAEQRERGVSSRSRGQTLMDQLGLAGVSPSMADLVERAYQASQVSDVPVLIFGESGTGKQRLAEAVHQLDLKRNRKPFVSVNCAAITGSLAESALFGHVKGAFTGATEDRPGYFRSADGGTLLLDEISELEPSLQGKLLRVLQEGKVMPVGSDKEYPVNVRIIAASNRDLEEMVARREFRLDLYQRIKVIQLNVPSLRERPDDIPPLVQLFVQRYASYYHDKIEGVEDRLIEALPHVIGNGNVRELENLIRQMLVFKKVGNRLELGDLPPEHQERLCRTALAGGMSPAALNPQTQAATETASDVDRYVSMVLEQGIPVPDVIEQAEREVMRKLLDASVGLTADQVAAKLGLPRRTFYHRLKKLGLTMAR